MRYFELIGDVHLPARWHLGKVSRGGIDQKLNLDAGRPIDEAPVEVEISHTGRALEFSITAFGIPVACDRLSFAIGVVAGLDLQRIPATVGGQLGYDVLNCVRLIDCLDEGKTKFAKWAPGDHRADLVGHYRWTADLTVDPRRIPPDAHFFRIARWTVALIVSEELKSAMEHVGCLGAQFEDVNP